MTNAQHNIVDLRDPLVWAGADVHGCSKTMPVSLSRQETRF